MWSPTSFLPSIPSLASPAPDLLSPEQLRSEFVHGSETSDTRPATVDQPRFPDDIPYKGPTEFGLVSKPRRGAAELDRLLRATDSTRVPYMPIVRAVRSKSHGYVYRVLSLTSGRMLHLQSRGEFHLAHPLDMGRYYTNLREGFGVPKQLTEEIAEAEGIRHPFNRFARENAMMSADFVGSKPGGGWLAIDYKPSQLAIRKRVKDKFKIIRMAFAEVGVEHVVITELDLSPVLIGNLQLLYTFASPIDPQPLPSSMLERVGPRMKIELIDGRSTIYEAAVRCESEFGCATGRLVRASLWLIARRHWHVDLTQKVHPDFPLHFHN